MEQRGTVYDTKVLNLFEAMNELGFTQEEKGTLFMPIVEEYTPYNDIYVDSVGLLEYPPEDIAFGKLAERVIAAYGVTDDHLLYISW